ncbi:MAG: aldehyde dehydrogenase family protein, partial [Pseudomonadales bacterium]
QSCIAAKRFIVEEPVYEDFVDALRAQFGKYKTGDPRSRETDIGPLARQDLAVELARQVDETVSAGAEMITGGRMDGDGYRQGTYYAPTILINVDPGMVAFSEELFGPVAPVTRARNIDEALAMANDSEFGLGGAIFTGDADRGWALACDKLETGTVAVNGQVQSDPRLPFGGIKSSGYGRELGEFGIREFVNVKTVSRF